jgi:hypothetical protein
VAYCLELAENTRNTLLIPCSAARFADFGQNSALLGESLKKSLFFSLLTGILPYKQQEESAGERVPIV